MLTPDPKMKAGETVEGRLSNALNSVSEKARTSLHGQSPVSASSILEAAIATVAQRGVDYSNPSGERSMRATVEAFNAITGLNLTTLQGWMFMCVLKLVRGQQSPHKGDTWLDGSAYFALAGEEAAK